ncbi:MAG: hypothetical protein ABII82_03725 [Verrucomicrobiota bacterium]
MTPRPASPAAARRLPRSRRGSLLIVAMLVAAFIALGLGSYLSFNLTSTRLAQRTFHRNAAFNLAECGLEEGLWSYNRTLSGETDGWTGWNTDAGSAWRKFDGFSFAAGTTGSVKVYATPRTPAEGTAPRVVALATIDTQSGTGTTQMIEVSLKRRSYFANGLTARRTLAFKGNSTTFDSWNSDPDNNPATAAVPYSPALAQDTGGVASSTVESTDLIFNNARIHGYVRTGGPYPTVGPQGLIGPAGTPDGVIDPDRVATDFSANFPDLAAPADGTVIGAIGPTLGTPGTSTSWICPALILKGNDTLTILGDVTLVLTDPIKALSITGKASIIIPAGSALTLYTPGDVLVAGNGLVNANASPATFRLWSTHTSDNFNQEIDITGNGSLSAVIYAPRADLTLRGNGDVQGAMVADTITLTGNAAFHYDEALANLSDHAGYRATGWRQLTGPEAAANSARFSGW